MDILTPKQRSALMAKIRAKDTKPELVVRSIAHKLGFRYRLHRRDLPGSPDLVFPYLGKVIFVHGCYWHRHPNCHYAYSPKSNMSFWQSKFDANIVRDRVAISELQKLGWHVIVIWECQTKNHKTLVQRLERRLRRKKKSTKKARTASFRENSNA